MMAQKPLMLKDYLELDSCSESSGAGFKCAPRWAGPSPATIRCLLEAELRRGGGRLVRSRSRNAFTKISAVINAVMFLPFLSSSSSAGGGQKEGFLSKSISKKLKGGFWKKSTHLREEVEEKRVRVKDIVRLRSFEEYGEERWPFDFPSPIISSCSSWSESECSGSDFLPSSIASSENLDEIASMAMAAGCEGKKASPPRSPNPKGRKVVDEDSGEKAAGDGDPMKIKKKNRMEIPGCHSDEDKEQLSPVSVIVFPSEEEGLSEDKETITSSPGSSPFHQGFTNIERAKLQLLQKIRQFESLADLEPVDLEQCFSECGDSEDEHLPESGDHHSSAADSHVEEERRAWALLRELKTSGSLAVMGPAQGSIEKLLLDFFIQGLACSESSDEDENHEMNHGRLLLRRRKLLTSRNAHGETVEDELLNAAMEWVERRWSGDDQDDFPVEKSTLGEMEKNGLCGCFDEEEKELGIELEGVVLRSLLEELAVDLLSSW